MEYNPKGISLFKLTFLKAILTMHNHELEVLPQVAYKLPKTTDTVLILDKLMLVRVGKNTLKLVSAHHAEITIINTVDYNKTKEDPVMQSFVLPSEEAIIGLHLIDLSNSTTTNPADLEEDSAKDENDTSSNSTSNSSGTVNFFQKREEGEGPGRAGPGGWGPPDPDNSLT